MPYVSKILSVFLNFICWLLFFFFKGRVKKKKKEKSKAFPYKPCSARVVTSSLLRLLLLCFFISGLMNSLHWCLWLSCILKLFQALVFLEAHQSVTFMIVVLGCAPVHWGSHGKCKPVKSQATVVDNLDLLWQMLYCFFSPIIEPHS